jgi:hypothetical protein
VVDLSQTGMAIKIVDPEDFLLFPVGRDIHGFLNLMREKYEVRGKVSRLAQDRVGCEFREISDSTSEALSQALDPERLGKALRPIPSPEQGLIWYHGPMGSDLLLWREPQGSIHRLIVFVHGLFVQWEEAQGLSTGSSLLSGAPLSTLGVVRLETLDLTPDRALNRDQLNIANRLILSSNLPTELKNWCVDRLKPCEET